MIMELLISALFGVIVFTAMLMTVFIFSVIYAIQETIKWRKNRLESTKVGDRPPPY